MNYPFEYGRLLEIVKQLIKELERENKNIDLYSFNRLKEYLKNNEDF